MADIKKKLRSEDGFIALIALGILGLLAVFGIITQLSMRSAMHSIQNNSDYFAAQDLTNSVVESLLFEMASIDEAIRAGYNNDLSCKWEDGILIEGPNAGCSNYDYAVNNVGEDAGGGISDDIEITYTIRGRAEHSTSTQICDLNLSANFNDNCYVIPLEGTGSAGKNCEDRDYLANEIEGSGGIDQLDDACHWNKLSFGNPLFSEVNLHLYHNDGGNSVNQPYRATNIPPPAGTDGIILRLRTPCLDDATNFCDIADRYDLAAALDEVEVVNWSLSGTCGGVDCSYIDSDEPTHNTKFLGKLINGDTPVAEYKLLQPASNIKDVNNNTTGNLFDINDPTSGDFITGIDNPILTLNLQQKLTADGGTLIPHLEYQLLTSKPVASPVTYITVDVSVNGNSYHKIVSRHNNDLSIDAAVNSN
jgi:hypothetical protein